MRGWHAQRAEGSIKLTGLPPPNALLRDYGLHNICGSLANRPEKGHRASVVLSSRRRRPQRRPCSGHGLHLFRRLSSPALGMPACLHVVTAGLTVADSSVVPAPGLRPTHILQHRRRPLLGNHLTVREGRAPAGRDVRAEAWMSSGTSSSI